MNARFASEVIQALQAGDAAGAERLCRRRLQTLPRDRHARALLPLTLTHQDRHAEAIPLFDALAREQTDEPAHAANLGLALIVVGRLEEAVTCLAAAAGRWPRDATIRAALGQARLLRGFAAAAVEDLEAALEMAPQDARAAALLARALVEAGGHQSRADQLADRLMKARLRDAATLAETAIALIGLQRDDDAEHCLRQALALDAAFDGALVHLASLYERQNEVARARATLDSVSEPTRADPLWQLVHGRLLRREKRYEEAAAALELLLAHTQRGPVAADAATEFGRVLHELGRTEAAFAAFERGNELMLEIESGRSGGRPLLADQGDWLLRTYTADEVAGWSPAVAAAPRTPIFVVGFPRSGTTLLENILDAHPALQALEEKPAVDAMLAQLERRGDLDTGLGGLDEATAAVLREAYWREAGRHVALRPDARLVDRYPLNMARLAVISRSFPGAPFVLVVRHPCDVVLSCFMQNFRIKDGTLGFHTLANGARVYDRLARKWLAEVEAFRPPLLTIRYEDLVADVRGNVARLVDFLGIAWDDRLLDHAAHATSRGRIHTPSYAQVVQPIYTSAIERWRRYAEHFGEALDVLAPWIRHWKYDGDTK